MFYLFQKEEGKRREIKISIREKHLLAESNLGSPGIWDDAQTTEYTGWTSF